MEEKRGISRRDFLSRSAKTAAIAATSSFISNVIPSKVLGANDRINIAVIGIRSRGSQHYREWVKNPNVHVKTLVDIDENLFPERVQELTELQGKKPNTEVDLRKMLEDKDIDAVSIASTDHWHALATIWACQAGKHVYVEKPTSHNIWEGRKMVEAARRYNRIVAVGMQNRSIRGVQSAMKFLHEGKLGDIYMAKGLCFKPRDSIGKKQNTQVPAGIHYDLWLGPAPYRPFNPNRFHYNWHWFWDYGCTDLGNQGPHQMDIARWGMNKNEYPQKIHCSGGYYAFDCDQETPNTQLATLKYDDGKILQFEVRGLYTNAEDNIKIGRKNFLVFNFHYFSTVNLLKSLFSPWRKDTASYGRGFDPKRFASILFGNLISRFLGAIVRTVIIAIGLVFEALTFVVGLFVFLIWFFLPLIIIAGFFYGIGLLL